jgi:general stress protein YciG
MAGQPQKERTHGNGKSERGFASMDRQRQREIASQGGRAAHAKGTAHEFDSEEARRAGQRGGEAVSRNREHMAEIGRKGGVSRSSRIATRNEVEKRVQEVREEEADRESNGE